MIGVVFRHIINLSFQGGNFPEKLKQTLVGQDPKKRLNQNVKLQIYFISFSVCKKKKKRSVTI